MTTCLAQAWVRDRARIVGDQALASFAAEMWQKHKGVMLPSSGVASADDVRVGNEDCPSLGILFCAQRVSSTDGTRHVALCASMGIIVQLYYIFHSQIVHRNHTQDHRR